MNADEFWDRVDAALDEKRDPLDDEAVQRHLAHDARAMEEYVRLARNLSSLPRRRSHWRVLAGAAAGGVLLVAALSIHKNVDSPPPAIASRVLDFKLSVVRQSGALRSTTTIEGDRRTDERELIVAATPDFLLPHATFTTITHRGIVP